jgi:hypothetical protein
MFFLLKYATIAALMFGILEPLEGYDQKLWIRAEAAYPG